MVGARPLFRLVARHAIRWVVGHAKVSFVVRTNTWLLLAGTLAACGERFTLNDERPDGGPSSTGDGSAGSSGSPSSGGAAGSSAGGESGSGTGGESGTSGAPASGGASGGAGAGG